MTRKLLLTQICPIEYTTDACVLVGCEHCNVKLNELLDDYDKHVIEQYKADTNLKDTIKDIHDSVSIEMYCKGIDDLRKAISNTTTYDECGNAVDVLEIAWKLKKKIAKQLKAGGKE